MTALALTMPDRRRLMALSIPFAAVVGSMAIGLLLIAASGKSVPDAIEAFLDGAFGTAFAVGASINRAVALALIGLGFILAARANLTNVGGEGQIAVGGIAATAVALWGPVADLPLGLAVLLPLLAGTYRLSIAIFDQGHVAPHVWHNQLYSFEVAQDVEDHGIVRLPHRWGLLTWHEPSDPA